MSTVELHALAPSPAELAEARMLAQELCLEYVDIDRYAVSRSVASMLRGDIARKHGAVVVGSRFGASVVAIADRDALRGMDEIRSAIGRDVYIVVSSKTQVDTYLERFYGGRREPARAQEAASPSEASHREVEQIYERLYEGASDPVAPRGDDADESPAPRLEGSGESLQQEVGGNIADEGDPGHEAPAAPGDLVEGSLPDAFSYQYQPAELVNEVTAGSPADDVFAEAGTWSGGAGDEAGPESVETEPPAELVIPALEPDVDAALDEALDTALADAAPGDPEDEEDESETPALAEILLESGQITREELEAALREQASTGRSLAQILGELGLVSDDDLIRATALEAGMEYVDLHDWATDPAAVSLLPESMARRHKVLAIGFRGEVPVIALSNPSDVFALDDLRMLLGREFMTVVASPRHIAEYISRAYRRDEEAEAAARSAAGGARETKQSALEISDLPAAVEDAPIVKYVNLVLRQALQERASDVHVEPTADDLRIRFRIDGVLHDMTHSPKSIHSGVTTRLKVMASLDIAEHRLPQDGRISVTVGDRHVDLRVATLPTVHGEKVVLRVLDKSNAMLDLKELGFLPGVKERYERAYRKPYGTILVTGPTGSGKSTTLYATLSALNTAERNLITVEDPVEYQLPGVTQVQVNPRAGLTFANALRSILRSDPDVVLVGEVRDRETAVIAIEAALTGHLVMTSVHTNQAAGTPLRLVEMGVEPFLVGSALDGVLAQRLARQLCENCATSHEPTAEELELVGWRDDDLPPDGTPRFMRAVGCQACSRTGYRGRLALHELMVMSEEIERAIVQSAAVEEINRLAVDQGMIPLKHDGLRKAGLGLTSIEEVLRVVV